MADTIKPSEIKKQTQPTVEDVKTMEATKVDETPKEKTKTLPKSLREKPPNSELSYAIAQYKGNKRFFWEFDKAGKVVFSNTHEKPPFTPPEFNEDSDKEG